MNNALIELIQSKIDSVYSEVKTIREHIHANPELSYQEHNTMEYVAQQLLEIGIPFEKGVGETGIIGLIKSSHHTNEQPCIALRADLDALPIKEQNEVSYKSKVDGVMHACGHDVHTAVLIGVSKILWELKDQLPQPVKLIFQPGEEKNPGGATYMIAAGCLTNPKVDRIYALHVFPDLPAGEVGFKEGLYMASCDEIHLTIHGKGGHGATPHQCIDPIVIGSEIILDLQTLVSRNCDPKIPCVLSFGHFEALGATNVIPEKAHIKGTFRTMDEPWRAKALAIIEERLNSIVKSHGATLELEISKGYPYLENDPEATRILKEKAIVAIGAEKVHDLPIRLTAEDFSYYSQEVPACFFRMGVKNEEKGIVYGVHHPRFDIEPTSMKTGLLMMCLAVF